MRISEAYLIKPYITNISIKLSYNFWLLFNGTFLPNTLVNSCSCLTQNTTETRSLVDNKSSFLRCYSSSNKTFSFQRWHKDQNYFLIARLSYVLSFAFVGWRSWNPFSHFSRTIKPKHEKHFLLHAFIVCFSSFNCEA